VCSSGGNRSERGKSNEPTSELGLLENALDDFGLFGLAGAEVAGSGLDGGQTEEGLDLGGVGSALAQAGRVSVATAVGPKAGEAGGLADGQDGPR
jgi:hypothetical protein